MHQITYISSRQPAVPPGVLEDILLRSRQRNLAAGVTGLLVFDGRRFLQALEGEREDVQAVYARIAADPRHRAIVLLSARDVAERSFGEWSMASQQLAAPVEAATLAGTVDALTACVTDPNARALFRSFARIERAAA